MALDGKDAQELVLKARLYDPQVTESRPLAIPTGELTVFYTLNGEENHRRFSVLADALLQDEESPSVFYEVTQEFETSLPEYDPRAPGARD